MLCDNEFYLFNFTYLKILIWLINRILENKFSKIQNLVMFVQVMFVFLEKGLYLFEMCLITNSVDYGLVFGTKKNLLDIVNLF